MRLILGIDPARPVGISHRDGEPDIVTQRLVKYVDNDGRLIGYTGGCFYHSNAAYFVNLHNSQLQDGNDDEHRREAD